MWSVYDVDLLVLIVCLGWLLVCWFSAGLVVLCMVVVVFAIGLVVFGDFGFLVYVCWLTVGDAELV